MTRVSSQRHKNLIYLTMMNSDLLHGILGRLESCELETKRIEASDVQLEVLPCIFAE
jgi:hypothetical protein